MAGSRDLESPAPSLPERGPACVDGCCAVGVEADLSVDGLCGRALNRSDRERSAEADELEELPGASFRTREPELPAEDEPMRLDGPVVLWASSRPPILSVPLGLPTSDGCGKAPWALSPVFGENRNVLGEEPPEAEFGVGDAENERGRSEPKLGVKLRVLGAPGLKLGEGAWLAGGLKEGREGAIWNDLPEPNDGPDGADGAGLA